MLSIRGVCLPHEMQLALAVGPENMGSSCRTSRLADALQCEDSKGEMCGRRASFGLRERSKNLIDGWCGSSG